MGLASFARSRNPLPLIGGTVLVSLYGIAGYRMHRGLRAGEQIAVGMSVLLEHKNERVLGFLAEYSNFRDCLSDDVEVLASRDCSR